MRIGYYVHHHGRGHATRAGAIGGALRAAGHEVTFLGSGALPDGDGVTLTPDVVVSPKAITGAGNSRAPYADETAHGRLHWAPLGGGYRTRSLEIAAWIDRAGPDVVIVDVSVEVTVLVRALGVPVVVVAQPGIRDDAPHELAYELAQAIIAPWPQGFAGPDGVAPQLARWSEKVVEVGGVSRFADRVRDPEGGPASGDEGFKTRPEPTPKDGLKSVSGQNGVILVGGEGWDNPRLAEAIAAAVPGITWHSPSLEHPVEDLLADADVVVSHAGQNALADIAAFLVPAVVLPQERPFGEQADMARALDRAGVAVGLPLGARADDVADALTRLRPGSAWRRWNIHGAAERAVAAVERAAGIVGTVDGTPRRATPGNPNDDETPDGTQGESRGQQTPEERPDHR